MDVFSDSLVDLKEDFGNNLGTCATRSFVDDGWKVLVLWC